MGFVTVWAWESVIQDDCYAIVLGPYNPERPFTKAERRVLAARVESLVQKMHNIAPGCKHEMTIRLYNRSWRNWFRKREWDHCLRCDCEVE